MIYSWITQYRAHELKYPAQRSGRFSELGSAQLSSKLLSSCWTLSETKRLCSVCCLSRAGDRSVTNGLLDAGKYARRKKDNAKSAYAAGAKADDYVGSESTSWYLLRTPTGAFGFTQSITYVSMEHLKGKVPKNTT